MENVREREFPVDQNFDGWRLDKFLTNRLGRISRSRAGDICRHGDITIIPERKVKPGTRLRTGDRVILRECLPPETVQYDEVDVLYEDDAIMVVNKPSGMLVHESPRVRLNTVQMFFEECGWAGAEPAHRIDRETSGALVCARTPAWVAPLRDMFATAHPHKLYRALVVDPDGIWEAREKATIEIPLQLATETRLGLRMIRGDLSAVTHVNFRRRIGQFADLEVQIETGRQHQIRVHLAMQGTPVAGDKLYTFDDAFFMALHDDPDDPGLLDQLPFSRHMLHAWRIHFAHPRTGDAFRVEAPLPQMWP